MGGSPPPRCRAPTPRIARSMASTARAARAASRCCACARAAAAVCHLHALTLCALFLGRCPRRALRRRALGSNLLSGTIPTSVGNLTALVNLCALAPVAAARRQARFREWACASCDAALVPTLNPHRRRQMQSNKLTGTVPTSLALLTRLTYLCARTSARIRPCCRTSTRLTTAPALARRAQAAQHQPAVRDAAGCARLASVGTDSAVRAVKLLPSPLAVMLHVLIRSSLFAA